MDEDENGDVPGTSGDCTGQTLGSRVMRTCVAGNGKQGGPGQIYSSALNAISEPCFRHVWCLVMLLLLWMSRGY